MPRKFNSAGPSKLVMRSLYIDQAADDELHLIADMHRVSKSELIRQMVSSQLHRIREASPVSDTNNVAVFRPDLINQLFDPTDK